MNTNDSLDPRVYQIACLTGLLVYGIGWLDFEVKPLNAIVMIATAQLTQLLCSRNWSIPFDPKSALISSLSLCLLVRTNEIEVAMLAAFVSIASKFALRWNGKHVWNPTNLGIALAIAVTGQAWVSPGQWGNQAWLAFLFACLGGLVVNRSARSDVTYAFLFFWLAALYGRSWSLGEPMTIPTHRLQSGAFLLFTFFMISDPKTTPNSRAGRILFAFLVAAGAYVVTFKWFRTNGLIWSLAVMSPLVPIIDKLLPGDLFQWAQPTVGRPPAPRPLPDRSLEGAWPAK